VFDVVVVAQCNHEVVKAFEKKILSPLPIIELRPDSSEPLSKLTEHVPSNLHRRGTLLEDYFSTPLTRHFLFLSNMATISNN